MRRYKTNSKGTYQITSPSSSAFLLAPATTGPVWVLLAVALVPEALATGVYSTGATTGVGLPDV